MTQQAYEENGSKFQHRSQNTNGNGYQNNNNNNTISVNSKAISFGNSNMFEMFEKGKGSAMLPSFLSFEPIPENKIFAKTNNRESFAKIEPTKVVGNQTKPVSVIMGSTSNPVKSLNANVKANRLTVVTNGFKCSNPVPHLVKPNQFVSISSDDHIQVKKFGSLMPPPPPSIKTSTCKTIHPSKVVKKRTLASAVSRKTSVAKSNINSQKRHSCAECDLGVTFLSKLDLQHHQSG